MYYTDLEELEKKFTMYDFPLNIGLEPTNYCNLNCTMCAHDKMTRKKGVMDIRLYKKIIDEVAQENPDTRLYLDFFGEPLLIKFKLFYMIDYAKKKGITSVNLNTNGLLLDEEMTEMLLDSGLNYLSLDCEGFSKEVYESIRVGGNRDKFFKNAEYLLKRVKERKALKNSPPPPIVDVKIIEMPENQHEVKQVMKHWQKLGAWVARRRPNSWAGSGTKGEFDLQKSRIACGRSVGIFTITWDGKITYCSGDADGKFIWGDVNDESIKSIWQRHNEQMVKYQLAHEWDKLPEFCQKCNDWQLIGEDRYDENGNPVNRNYEAKGKVFEEKKK